MPRRFKDVTLTGELQRATNELIGTIERVETRDHDVFEPIKEADAKRQHRSLAGIVGGGYANPAFWSK